MLSKLKLKAQIIGGTEHKIWKACVKKPTVKCGGEEGGRNNEPTDKSKNLAYTIRAPISSRDKVLRKK
jgi:hypothetical protein